MSSKKDRISVSSNSTTSTATRRSSWTVLVLYRNKLSEFVADLGLPQSSPAKTTIVLDTPSLDYYGLINADEKAADAQEEQKVHLLLPMLDLKVERDLTKLVS